MAFKYGTICSKHDKIKDAANHIRSLCSDLAEKDRLTRDSIDALAYLIVDLAEKCFDDGQRMEVGLDTKAGRIAELEEQVKQLEGQIEDLKESIP